MAAGAALETRAGDDQPAIAADIERMGAAMAVLAAATPREGRPVDADSARRIARGSYALLAVAEQSLGNAEVALLDADAGAVAVGDAHVLAHRKSTRLTSS